MPEIQAIEAPRLRGDGGEESLRAWCIVGAPTGRFDAMKEAPMSAQPRKVVHPDIKPENTPELASRYLDVPNMPWEPTKFAGIRIKVLYGDDSGITTAARSGRRRTAARAHRARADVRARGHPRGSRGRVRAGSVRLAPGRQSARGGGAQRRRHPRILPQAQPLCPRREILHRGWGEIEATAATRTAASAPRGPGGGRALAGPGKVSESRNRD